MKRIIVWFFISAIFISVCFACKEKKEEASLQEPKENSPESIIVKVNGEGITMAELDKEVDNIIKQYKSQAKGTEIEAMPDGLREQGLENLINRKILLQKAEAANIQPDIKMIDEQLSQIVARFPSYAQFIEHLSKLGISEDQLKKDIEMNIKIKTFIDSQVPQPDVIKDEEIEEFYRNNPENFKTSERIRASHILLSIKPQDTPETQKEKREKLSNLREEILKGADFAELAKKYSDCPSKTQGGDLGFFERGRMVKSFEDAAFELKEGEVSEVVETEFGYHLIKLTGRQAQDVAPLEDVKEKIRSYISYQKREMGIKEFLTRVREESNVEYSKMFKP